MTVELTDPQASALLAVNTSVQKLKTTSNAAAIKAVQTASALAVKPLTPAPPAPPVPVVTQVTNLKAAWTDSSHATVTWTNPSPPQASTTVARNGTELGGTAVGWSGTVAGTVTSQVFGNLDPAQAYTFSITPAGGAVASIAIPAQSKPTPTPTPTPTPSGTNPSGQAPPAPGSGWKVGFVEDFNVTVPKGSFPDFSGGKVGNTMWYSYNGNNDTRGTGTYNSGLTSVGETVPGCLEMNLQAHGPNGKPNCCAPNPEFSNLYMNVQVRAKFQGAQGGWYPAWLLWPLDENWNEGELDFPEGDMGGTINAYAHNTQGNPSQNVLAQNTGVSFNDGQWHTYEKEWTSSGVRFILDGKVVGSIPAGNGTPTTPMRVTLQTETDGQPAGDCLVLIDWVQCLVPA